MVNVYSTLDEAREYLSLGSQNTSDDAAIEKFLIRASRSIDAFTRRQFYPRRKTLRLDHPPDSLTLGFRDDILEVKGLSDLAGSSEIDTSVYWLRCGLDYNLTPYDTLEIDDSSGSLLKWSGTDKRSVRVDAVLGFRSEYDNDAWIDSDSTNSGSVAAGASSFDISGASTGINALGLEPKFQRGNLIKMGSDSSEEFMIITGGSGTSNIHVLRGQNGTTAASHASGTAIEVFSVEPDIAWATLRLSQWSYLQSMSPFTGRVILNNFGGVEVPDAWPIDVMDRLKRFRKNKIRSVRLRPADAIV